MKKAFTLIELIISVILLSLIVTFLYQSLAQLQNSNLQFISKTDKLGKREAILKVFYNDLMNARSIEWADKGKDHDVILIETNNSYHNMSVPFVLYKVYRDKNTLKRVESPVAKINYIDNVFKFNDIIEEVKLFKVYEKNGHYLVYLKAEGIEDIYLDILPPSFIGSKGISRNSNGGNADNNISDEVQ